MRALKYMLGLVLLGCAILPVYYGYERPSAAPTQCDDSPSEHLLEIKGFGYDGRHEGRKVLEITADRLIIKRKKLGFFSIARLKDLRLENAVVRLYPMALEHEKKGLDETQASAFDAVISQIDWPVVRAKRITSVRMAPVRVELWDNQTVMTRIVAATATIRLKPRDILFKKRVKMDSGPRTLTAQMLSLCPDKLGVEVIGVYELTTPDGLKTGERLKTDFYLNVLN